MPPTLPTEADRRPPWARELLNTLSPRQREALVLRQTGMRWEELSRLLEMPVEQVRELVHQAWEGVTAAVHARAGNAASPPPAAPPGPVPAERRAVLDLKVGMLPVGAPILQVLVDNQVDSVGQVVALTEAGLLRMKGLLPEMVPEVRDAVAALGLKLGMDVGDWLPNPKPDGDPTFLPWWR